MPMKDFRCTKHDPPVEFERLVKMDVEEAQCPECGAPAPRIYKIESRGPIDQVNMKSVRFHFNWDE